MQTKIGLHGVIANTWSNQLWNLHN